MNPCSYLYDTDGLRWEDGNVLVHLLVDGKAATFSVVRSGSGRSRIERFADKAHPLNTAERTIFGEITTADLARLCRAGSLVVGGLESVPGRRTTLALASSAKADTDTNCTVLAVTDQGEFETVLDPQRCTGGNGRSDRYSQLRAAIGRRPTGQRTNLALSQLATMPKSGRAGAAAARQRLRATVEFVTNTELLRAVESNPDVLLHLTAATFAVLQERREPQDVRSLDTLVQRAADAALGTQASNVVVTVTALAATEDGIVGDDICARIAREVREQHGDCRPLELLVEHGTADQILAVLEQAAVSEPRHVYTFELMSMLSRVGNQTATSVAEQVARRGAETLAAQAGVMTMLAPTLRALVIEHAPLIVLSSAAITGDEVRQACAALDGQLRELSGNPDQRSELVRVIDDLPDDVRAVVLDTLDEASNAAPVVAGVERLEAQRRARLRSAVREVQLLTDALNRSVTTLGGDLHRIGEGCLEQARNAPLAMLSVRHGGLLTSVHGARFAHNRTDLDRAKRDGRTGSRRRLDDLRAGTDLLASAAADYAMMAELTAAVGSLGAWYLRQNEYLDAIDYPRTHIDSARLNTAGRDLVALGERLRTEVATRAEDIKNIAATLIER